MIRSVARSTYDLLRRAQRRFQWMRAAIAAPRSSFVRFTCNLCGRRASFPRTMMTREAPSCVHCGSTVRFRSIIHVLSTALFGESLLLKNFPTRKDLVGIGMSDWRGYASQLEKKFTYVNSYYHKDPILDIANVEEGSFGKYDFVISTEVFEHVPQPVTRAFRNAFQLLKPGGIFVFSVPFREGETKEHFPELHDFNMFQENGRWVLVNKTLDGREQHFDELIFHGGPGTTLEMREFGEDSLANHLQEVGFQQIRNFTDEIPEFGIVGVPDRGDTTDSSAGRLEAPPWSARKI